MPNAGIDAPVCQCSRCDVKQNLKAYTKVTCSELVPLNVMLHVHVHILRVTKPLYCVNCYTRDTPHDPCYDCVRVPETHLSNPTSYFMGFSISWSWWRHQREAYSASLALCAGNSPVTGEFPSQMPVTRSFDVFFDLRLNKRLSKQPWGWWFETPSRSLWSHCNVFLDHDLLQDCSFSGMPIAVWRN